MEYPAAPPGDAVDLLHGRQVADPYRWLEDADTTATRVWSAAQDGLLTEWFATGRADGRARWAGELRGLLPGMVGLPVARGERLFWERRSPSQDHPVLVVDDRVLIDPSTLSADHTTTLDGWWPSEDGARLAYVVSQGGTEMATLYVLDVDTTDVVDGPIVCGRGPDVAWLPGRDEIVYVRQLPDLPDDEAQLHRRVWRRRVGTPVGDDQMVFGVDRDKTTYYSVETSPDGRWVVVHAGLGTAPRNDVYIADAMRDAWTWTPIQEGEDVQTWAHLAHDGRLYLLTNRDAPRRRLAVADPSQPDVSHWEALIDEGDGVLDGFTVTNHAIVVSSTRDVVAHVDVFERTTGVFRYEVTLAGIGTGTGSAAIRGRREGGNDIWVAYTDFVTPTRVLTATIPAEQPTATVVLQPWADPPGMAAPQPIVTEQVWATSADGTRVPMFVIYRAPDEPGAADEASGSHGSTASDEEAASYEASDRPHAPRPTILYGYGGFEVALTPAYSALATAWALAGGVFVSANLRGGSEFGEEWHRAGMRAAKQNVFDDFIACAEWLIDEGWTTPNRLGIYGGSNGGLLVGAAMTQRPELFGGVVCSAPLLDMVRYEQFGLGVTWNDEYGSAADPEELGWLLGYSPYHHVRGGERYPATLFTVFDGDTRVDPLHARKTCAALQAATTATVDEAPILIRREADVGHATRSIGRTVALSADILTFMADRLGLDPPAQPSA